MTAGAAGLSEAGDMDGDGGVTDVFFFLNKIKKLRNDDASTIIRQPGCCLGSNPGCFFKHWPSSFSQFLWFV